LKYFNSDVRKRVSLEGVWKLLASEEETLPRDWGNALEIALPGVWNLQVPELFYCDLAWVEREVFIPSTWPEDAWLFCGNHSWKISAWVNGTHAGDHEGYLSTYFDVRLRPGVENSFALRIDSRESADRIGTRCDWIDYGGVFDRIEVEARGDAYVEDLALRTRLMEGSATVRVKVRVSGEKSWLTLRILDEKEEKASKRVPVDTNVMDELEEVLTFKHPVTWSPEMPKLYELEATLSRDGQLIDQVSLNFGVREIEFTPGGIQLNGKPVMIKGMLHFHDHPEGGRYLPRNAVLYDFRLATKANVNAWRTHYPTCLDFLDLADRYGFFVIESIPLTWEDDIEDPRIVDQAKRQLAEMIRQDENHPSIIMWGIWNELLQCGKETCRKATEELIDCVRELDSSREPIYATLAAAPMRIEELPLSRILQLYPGEEWLEDASLDLPGLKVIGANLFKEPGEAGEAMTELRRRASGKSILITEFGWPSIPGARYFHAPLWSEDSQAKKARDYLETMSKTGLCGFVFACWSDWKTARSLFGLTSPKPCEVSWYGVLDEYRRPKIAYDVVKELYGKLK